MLLNAFTRALRDGFPPARVAGLKAIIATGGQAHGRCWLCKGEYWTAAVHVELEDISLAGCTVWHHGQPATAAHLLSC